MMRSIGCLAVIGLQLALAACSTPGDLNRVRAENANDTEEADTAQGTLDAATQVAQVTAADSAALSLSPKAVGELAALSATMNMSCR
ncbi:hypothetical protein ACFOGJ_04535 [Marinibaculum pumilum]|uniref:Lipoprotein n=1 Tax=Marinibaculum pumilum TaxID=1766165 RepID=A0ABV7KVV2_9PROT